MADAVHVPGLAVSFDPAASVPEIVGVDHRITRNVAADVFVAVAAPAFLPVTFTVIALPSCAVVGTNVVAVAPVIATPSAYH